MALTYPWLDAPRCQVLLDLTFSKVGWRPGGRQKKSEMANYDVGMHDVAGLVEQRVNKSNYPEAYTWASLKCVKHAVPKWIAAISSIITLIIISVSVDHPPPPPARRARRALPVVFVVVSCRKGPDDATLIGPLPMRAVGTALGLAAGRRPHTFSPGSSSFEASAPPPPCPRASPPGLTRWCAAPGCALLSSISPARTRLPVPEPLLSSPSP